MQPAGFRDYLSSGMLKFSVTWKESKISHALVKWRLSGNPIKFSGRRYPHFCSPELAPKLLKETANICSFPLEQPQKNIFFLLWVRVVA